MKTVIADKVAREISSTIRSWYISMGEHEENEIYDLVYNVVKGCDRNDD